MFNRATAFKSGLLTVAAATLGVLALACPASAQLPAPLEAALSQTLATRTPGRVDMRWTVDGESLRFEMRPAGEGVPTAFILIEPDEATLSEGQREIWTSVSEPDEAEAETDVEADEDGEKASMGIGSVDLEELRATVGDDIRLDREEADGTLVYAFRPAAMPGASDTPRAMLEALSGEIRVDPVRNELRGVRLFALESFKPNIAARVERFEMSQSFVHDPALGGPRFASMAMSVAGSAAFQAFEQAMMIEVLAVDWAEAAPASVPVLGENAESP